MSKLMGRLAAVCLCCVWSLAAPSAQTNPTPGKAQAGTHPSKPQRRTVKATSAPSGGAANLNAPSTDFSTVEPETGEPRPGRQHGPTVRPGLDGSGRPTMGLGF